MRLLLVVTVCLMSVFIHAQRPIAISEKETVSLVFPFPIIHVDRGSKDVIVDRPRGADNILLLKCISGEFGETNLSVITSDRSVYVFRLQHFDAPSQFLYNIGPQNDASVATYANGVLDNPTSLRGPRMEKNVLEARIAGIYIHGDVMYYQLLLSNHSSIPYDIALCQWSLRDEQRSRRTATQERILVPLHISGNQRSVPALGSSVQVFAFPKLTIPDAKILCVQLFEKNGGRHLTLTLRNRHLLRAIPLPDLY